MELRSTGNPDTSNPATMSMLEYLERKGIEAMSGTCKYPESVCPHMMMFKGKKYCGATPCQLTGELPKRTNSNRIRNMSDEELAKFLSECADCATCPLVNPKNCGTEETCVKAFLEWLKQPVEE